jgi:hypothetical protein
MTIKIVEHTVTSDVATGGTFTVGYPTGCTKGTFLKGKNHKMICQNALFTAPTDFTCSFGASSVTVTYNGTTTLAAGAALRFQFDVQGEDVLDVYSELVGNPVSNLVPLFINLGSPIVADIDSIIDGATSTELPDGTPTTITYTQDDIGTSPCDGVNTTWVLATPRNLTMTVTHGSSIVACEARITGLDAFGEIMNETLAVTATGTTKTATGIKAFKEITSIVLYAATDMSANTVEIGHGSVLGLPVYVGTVRQVIAELVDGVALPRFNDYIQCPFQLTEAEMDAAGSFWIIPNVTGVIHDAATVVENTVTTGGTITFEIGGTAVDGLDVVIANSAAAGEVDTATATYGHASTAITAGTAIEIVVPSAFNASAPVNGYVGIMRTAQTRGTFVGGLTPATKSTATTADVRGTYQPAVTMDGSTGISLFVMVTDPTFLGNPQYAG